MRSRIFVACAMALAIGLFSFNLSAQVVPKSIQEGGTDSALRERKNAWTVGIVGGLLSGSYMRFADEMASALNDGDKLRILPIVSYGAACNLDDLLYLHGVDVAITQSDVFEYFRTAAQDAQSRPPSPVHHPAAHFGTAHSGTRRRPEPGRPARQEGQFRSGRNGASLTGTIVFQRLGIDVQQVLIPQPSALQMLQAGRD